ncbi:DUF3142 domain-containing protein [Sphingomonas sp. URHD0057]|uniref:DUF3142 domain-containing protein n=1 Tax=Sphingomonas sp. URHD0057 TaxID=1380389 RepID=UPI0018CC0434|nr:DUF3142 domain-containing protein [Sphingomonas sp. URHD0057]
MRRCAFALAGLLLAGCREPDRVDARDYDAFWLWAGVAPQPVLEQARTIYILDGEVRDGAAIRFTRLLAQPPRLRDKQVWLVVRTDTIDWPAEAYEPVLRDLEAWHDPAGVQIDFDAKTRKLGRYAAFLRDFRNRLPGRYRLSVTGLLDWSANGDPQALRSLRGTVDEVVIQTYQGRSTIWGYERYFERMRGFPIPFRVGLVQGGRWIEPASLPTERNFKGYVVFLINPRR